MTGKRLYRVRRILFGENVRPVLLQSENGPCALLAMANTLFLRGRLEIHEDVNSLGFDELVSMIVNLLLDKPNSTDDHISGAVRLLPHLDEGMHVNPFFGDAGRFEVSSELSIFSLFEIPVYHTWVVSEEDDSVFPYLGGISYDQASLLLASAPSSPSAAPSLQPEGLQEISKWLRTNASQTTVDGVAQVAGRVQQGTTAVLFRNNHFSTVTSKDGTLYALATDESLADEDGAVWERIDQVDGNTVFVDMTFQSFRVQAKPIPPGQAERRALTSYPSAPAVRRPNKKSCIIC